MKAHKRNGVKKRELTHIAKHVVSSYITGKPVSMTWISYRFPKRHYKVDEYNQVTKTEHTVYVEIPRHYYDVANLTIGEKPFLSLKTPNNKRIARLEKIAYNSVEIILSKNSKQDIELASRLSVALKEENYLPNISYSETH